MLKSQQSNIGVTLIKMTNIFPQITSLIFHINSKKYFRSDVHIGPSLNERTYTLYMAILRSRMDRRFSFLENKKQVSLKKCRVNPNKVDKHKNCQMNQ